MSSHKSSKSSASFENMKDAQSFLRRRLRVKKGSASELERLPGKRNKKKLPSLHFKKGPSMEMEMEMKEEPSFLEQIPIRIFSGNLVKASLDKSKVSVAF